MYYLDKKILNFKFKGVFAYYLLIGVLIILFYPVNSSENFVNMCLSSFFTYTIYLTNIFLFAYFAVKTPQARKSSLLFIFGFILYALGSIISDELVLKPIVIMFGFQVRIIIHIIVSVLLIASILFLYLGGCGLMLKPSKDVLSELYAKKKICIVHKGKIKGKVFFCSNCLVKYCERCFKKVVEVENKCWACEKEIKSVELSDTFVIACSSFLFVILIIFSL